MDIPRSPVPERVLRRNPARRIADRHVRLVILAAALCAGSVSALVLALQPGGGDGETTLLAGSIAFVVCVTALQRR